MRSSIDRAIAVSFGKAWGMTHHDAICSDPGVTGQVAVNSMQADIREHSR
jgi:hypothetical protein